MGTILPALLSSSNPFTFYHRIPPKTPKSCYPKTKISRSTQNGINKKKAMAALMGAGFALTTPLFVGPASALAAELPLLVDSSMQLMEPSNALSLPTWAIHVSSVAEWVAAMILVWQYGEKSGYQSWKGLSWGMVPLLGGAFCACTWHFFYNSESLEILVAIQGALTVIGNTTMCLAAYRIYKSSQERSTDCDQCQSILRKPVPSLQERSPCSALSQLLNVSLTLLGGPNIYLIVQDEPILGRSLAKHPQ